MLPFRQGSERHNHGQLGSFFVTKMCCWTAMTGERTRATVRMSVRNEYIDLVRESLLAALLLVWIHDTFAYHLCRNAVYTSNRSQSFPDQQKPMIKRLLRCNITAAIVQVFTDTARAWVLGGFRGFSGISVALANLKDRIIMYQLLWSSILLAFQLWLRSLKGRQCCHRYWSAAFVSLSGILDLQSENNRNVVRLIEIALNDRCGV